MWTNKTITTKRYAVWNGKGQIFCHLFTKIIEIGTSAHFSVFTISLLYRIFSASFCVCVCSVLSILNYNENTHKHMPNIHKKWAEKKQNQTNSFCFDEFRRINIFFRCLFFCCVRFAMTSNWNVIRDDDLATGSVTTLNSATRITSHHIIAVSITIQRAERQRERVR